MKSFLTALTVLLAAGSAAAQDVAELPAARLAAAADIRVDGRLDEAAWLAAAPITEFRQEEPDQGVPASERTEVRVAADADALYVAARLHDSRPPTVALGRRDGDIPSDWFGVVLDTRHDHRSGFGFWVNAAGVRSDSRVTDALHDRSWDAVWEAAVQVDSGGWTVEMRIPLSQLRFEAGSPRWGMQINRYLKRREEDAVWSFTPSGDRGGPARYGHLEGTENLRTAARLEAAPYSVARSERVDRGGSAFRSDEEYGASVGVDLKYRLTGTLTLDATLNPDFGTVEQDPSQVNLTAFELELPERRPFFVEGADVFEFGRGATGMGAASRRLFYPRRIGRSPQLGGPDGADRPDVSTILGAAKLTGTLPGGWTVGMLNALTQEERVRWVDSAGTIRGAMAEPLTGYFAARAGREWREGATWVGLMGTSVQRRLDAEAAGTLRRGSAVLGADWSHEWDRRAWRLSGYLAGSRVAGSRAAILRTQTASSRYLQRPDAGHLGVDSTATALAGWAGQLQLTRQAGEHWLGDAWVSATSPGYEVNDLGFTVRSDLRSAGARLTYRETRPGELLRRWSATAHARADYNGAGDRQWGFLWMGSEATTAGYWRGVLNAAVVAPRMDDRLTRGGPVVRLPGEFRLYSEIGSDARRALTGGAGVYLRRAGAGGSEAYGWTRIGLRPSPQWSLSLRPELTRLVNPVHYVRQAEDPTAAHTFGRRYVFADLRQTTAAVEARLERIFSPDLSVQLFARPFVSAGRVAGYKELARPRSLEWAVYGADQGTAEPLADGRWVLDADGPGPARESTVGDALGETDFVVRTLRGSAVLRWEWRPGSTLYLAWQQSRDDEERRGGVFHAGRDGAALFGTPPDNVFVIKLSYWLNR